MSTANLDVFRNGIFVFKVHGIPFAVYKELIARNSRPLKAMMENGMKGSQEGSEALEDTDELTFGRFVEFINTGDYNPSEAVPGVPTSPSEESDGDRDEEAPEAAPVVDERASPAEQAPWEFPEETAPARESWDDFEIGPLAGKDKKDKKDKYLSKKPNWPSLDVEIRTHTPLPTGSVLDSDCDWSLDYLPVFLSHAQLYVFADTYEIPDLQDLAAARLHNALSLFQYAPGSTTNIADLVSYAYEHTPDRTDEVAKLRTVVAHFCANNTQALTTSKSFLELLRSGGEFVLDLMRKMVENSGHAHDAIPSPDRDSFFSTSRTNKKKRTGW